MKRETEFTAKALEAILSFNKLINKLDDMQINLEEAFDPVCERLEIGLCLMYSHDDDSADEVGSCIQDYIHTQKTTYKGKRIRFATPASFALFLEHNFSYEKTPKPHTTRKITPQNPN